MNIKQKITSAIAIGTMMASVIAPASFAATTVDISGNGALSTNRVKVRNVHRSTVTQSNTTVARTRISLKAKTGNNTSSFNTGGSSSITTGDATNTVTVNVTGGDNTNNGDECGCVDPTTNVTIADNGALSTNTVRVRNINESDVTQTNSTVASTTVHTTASTGGNDSSFNTDGGNTIDSGAASNTVTVTVTGSSNTN